MIRGNGGLAFVFGEQILDQQVLIGLGQAVPKVLDADVAGIDLAVEFAAPLGRIERGHQVGEIVGDHPEQGLAQAGKRQPLPLAYLPHERFRVPAGRKLFQPVEKVLADVGLGFLGENSLERLRRLPKHPLAQNLHGLLGDLVAVFELGGDQGQVLDQLVVEQIEQNEVLDHPGELLADGLDVQGIHQIGLVDCLGRNR